MKKGHPGHSVGQDEKCLEINTYVIGWNQLQNKSFKTLITVVVILLDGQLMGFMV